MFLGTVQKEGFETSPEVFCDEVTFPKQQTIMINLLFTVHRDQIRWNSAQTIRICPRTLSRPLVRTLQISRNEWSSGPGCFLHTSQNIRTCTQCGATWWPIFGVFFFILLFFYIGRGRLGETSGGCKFSSTYLAFEHAVRLAGRCIRLSWLATCPPIFCWNAGNRFP